MFYKVLNMLLLSKFVIFVIKLNPICPNNNPKLQNFFKKSEVASKGIIYSCERLHLRFGGFPTSVSAELHSHNIALASRQTDLQEKHATAVGAKDSGNDTVFIKVI